MQDKETDEKYLTVERMKELLKELPDDYRISPNAVGNTRILNSEHEYIGIIDFLFAGEIDIW